MQCWKCTIPTTTLLLLTYQSDYLWQTSTFIGLRHLLIPKVHLPVWKRTSNRRAAIYNSGPTEHSRGGHVGHVPLSRNLYRHEIQSIRRRPTTPCLPDLHFASRECPRWNKFLAMPSPDGQVARLHLLHFAPPPPLATCQCYATPRPFPQSVCPLQKDVTLLQMRVVVVWTSLVALCSVVERL